MEASCLHDIVRRVREAAQSGDPDGFAELLRGTGFPAVGGDDGPGRLILSALVYDTNSRVTVASLQRLAKSLLPPDFEKYEADVFRELLIVSDVFPLDRAFFFKLKKSISMMDSLVLPSGDGLLHMFRSVLARHQVDESLEAYWLDLLRSRNFDDALESWEGLLLIPPTKEMLARGWIVNLDRINTYLTSLEEIWSTVASAKKELREALFWKLTEIFPRSSQFWVRLLGGQRRYVAMWPKLQEWGVSLPGVESPDTEGDVPSGKIPGGLAVSAVVPTFIVPSMHVYRQAETATWMQQMQNNTEPLEVSFANFKPEMSRTPVCNPPLGGIVFVEREGTCTLRQSVCDRAWFDFGVQSAVSPSSSRRRKRNR